MHDSLLVTVPKYGFVMYVFDATDLRQQARPVGYHRKLMIESLKINTPEFGKDLTTNYDARFYSYSLTPSNPKYKAVKWEWKKIPDTLEVYISVDEDDMLAINSGSTCKSNGKVQIKVRALDDSSLVDSMEVDISGQIDEGLVDCTSLPPVQDTTVSTLTWVRTFKAEGVTVYPNPASEIITVSWPQLPDFRVSVVNTLGRVVYSQEGNGTAHMVLDVGSLESGLYTVLCSTPAGKAASYRIKRK